MKNSKCNDSGKTFENDMQLEFHICLGSDPVSDAKKNKNIADSFHEVLKSKNYERLQAVYYYLESGIDAMGFELTLSQCTGYIDESISILQFEKRRAEHDG